MRTAPQPIHKQIMQWRTRLIRLPESVFLDLFRNYLGEVRTPFNKQELLSRLESFLGKAEVQDRLQTLLTLADRQLLSAVAIIPGSSEERLFNLAGEGRSFLEFHLHLLNLEDRLLIFREDESHAVWLNPHLEACLRPWLSQALVVPSLETETQAAATEPWLDEAFLAALFCFINERPDIVPSSGKLKKRAYDDFAQRFAGLRERVPAKLGSLYPEAYDALGGTAEAEPADALKSALLLALAALRNLGLAIPGSAGLQVDYERWLEFAALDPLPRRWLAWAAGLVPESSPGAKAGPVYFNQNRIAKFAHALEAWLACLVPGQAYQASALLTLWELHAGMELPSSEVRRIVEGLVLLGAVVRAGDSWQCNPLLEPSPATAKPETAKPLVLTPAFEIRLSGPIALDQRLSLAAFCQLLDHETSTGLALNRASVQAGFSRGLDADAICALLKELSGRPVPQNVRISIEEWQRDWQSLKVYDGIVLAAQGPRQTVLEHLAELEPFILARLAPGVIVLERHAIPAWRPILIEAGIPAQVLPDEASLGPDAAFAGAVFPSLASLELEGLGSRRARSAAVSAAGPGTAPLDDQILPPRQDQANRQSLVEALQALRRAQDLGDEIDEALEKRINQGLILLESQVSAAHVRLERSEAGGLDYTAKLRVLEQAIKTQRDFVEITQHAEHGASYKLLVWPLRVRQIGSELVLIAQSLPGGKELSLQVSRILSVRRIRSSIFG